MTALSVHGIVPVSSDRGGAEDVDLVEFASVAALATPAPEPGARPRREDLMRHSEVLQQAVARGTVLPLRMGTVFGSREELLADFLQPRHDELAALLAELDGKVEMSFKGTLREDAVLRELVTSDPEMAALRDATRSRPEAVSYPERVRLGELAAAGMARWREEYERRLADLVAPHAAATVFPEEPRAVGAVDASLLLPRAGVEELESALEEFAREHAEYLEARLLGPLPPYSFVALAERAERAV